MSKAEKQAVGLFSDAWTLLQDKIVMSNTSVSLAMGPPVVPVVLLLRVADG